MKRNVYVAITLLAIVFLAATPFLQPVILGIMSKNCPVLGDRVECGLEQGYENAFYAEVIPWVWLIVGLILLAVGLYQLWSIRGTAKKS